MTKNIGNGKQFGKPNRCGRKNNKPQIVMRYSRQCVMMMSETKKNGNAEQKKSHASKKDGGDPTIRTSSKKMLTPRIGCAIHVLVDQMVMQTVTSLFETTTVCDFSSGRHSRPPGGFFVCSTTSCGLSLFVL